MWARSLSLAIESRPRSQIPLAAGACFGGEVFYAKLQRNKCSWTILVFCTLGLIPFWSIVSSLPKQNKRKHFVKDGISLRYLVFMRRGGFLK